MKTMRYKFLAFFLFVAFTLNAVGQQKPALDDAPSPRRLRSHITYLASDRLEGRRTGTAGARGAAEYIAGEFSRYGLRRSNGVDRPGMSILEANSPNRYLQAFPFVGGVGLGRNNVLTVKLNTGNDTVVPVVGEDWMPLGFSSSAKIENAPVVFVNYGITAKELNHDDYAKVDVKDKIAIALDGTPDGDNPHGSFGRYADPRWKAIAAKDKGAKALVLLSQKDKFSDDTISELRYDNAGESGLPVIVVGKPAANRLLTDMKSSWSLSTDVVRRETPAANVIGILDGSDPKLKNEAIVIGAHYDHLGRGGQGSLAPREGEIHYGADDNASGVAGLLELARIFSSERPRPKRTIIFIAFSGEEEGLLGSNYYVHHPVMPLAETVAMINMDMIGRLKEDKLIVGGLGTSSEWREMINSMNKPFIAATATDRNVVTPSTNAKLTSFNLTLNEDGYGPSDHASFYAKKVPVLFFWTGTHEDYHKPSDTAEKINYEGEARILSLVLQLVRALGRSDHRPTYTVAKSESRGRTMGFKVSLGTIPNYAESNDGLKLDGVRDDSPAARAGLKANDVIVRLAGRDVRNVYDYTYALGEMKAGEEYEVEVMRGGERLLLKIIPAARR